VRFGQSSGRRAEGSKIMNTNSKRVVLITGASSGIGQACALRLTQGGFQVYGTSRRADAARAGQTPLFELIPMDVDDDASVKQGVELVLSKAGRLDAVVNNAGFGLAGAVEDTTVAEAKAQFETSFFGVLRVCREVLPVMRRQQAGYIVNVSSVAGAIAIPFQSMYSAAKFALEGLTEALRMEVKPFGIRVVLVEPGDVRTPFTANRRRTLASAVNPAYAEALKRALGVMENDETHGEGPEGVARLVERILNMHQPGLRYVAGPAYEVLAIGLKKILPGSVFEWGLSKYYKV
jgi:NAD(P)-dependent dehydrogenase (short-subunit alcohol dehydrogenase family)